MAVTALNREECSPAEVKIAASCKSLCELIIDTRFDIFYYMFNSLTF